MFSSKLVSGLSRLSDHKTQTVSLHFVFYALLSWYDCMKPMGYVTWGLIIDDNDLTACPHTQNDGFYIACCVLLSQNVTAVFLEKHIRTPKT